MRSLRLVTTLGLLPCIAAALVAGCSSDGGGSACSGAACGSDSSADDSSAAAEAGSDGGGTPAEAAPPDAANDATVSDAPADARADSVADGGDAAASDAAGDAGSPWDAASLALACPDPAFGTQGVAQLPLPPNPGNGGLAVQPDGKILVYGTFGTGSGPKVAIARLASDGTPDPSFGTAGIATLTPPLSQNYGSGGIALQSDGKILVSGFGAGDGGAQSGFVARVSTAGVLDTTFGTAGYAASPTSAVRFWGLAVRPDDTIVAVGDQGGSPFVGLVASYGASGQLDATFGTGGFTTTAFGPLGIFESATLQGDGKVIAAGWTYVNQDGGTHRDFPVLARYTTAGVLDGTFGSAGTVAMDVYGGGYYLPGGAVVQSTGSIVVGVESSNGPTDDFILRRYTSSGQVDTTFGTGGSTHTDFFGASDVVSGLVLMPNDALLVAGTVSEPGDAGTVQEFGLARYTAGGALDTSFGVGGKVVTRFAGQTQNFVLYRGLAREPDGMVVVAGRGSAPTGDAGTTPLFDLVRYACP